MRGWSIAGETAVEHDGRPHELQVGEPGVGHLGVGEPLLRLERFQVVAVVGVVGHDQVRLVPAAAQVEVQRVHRRLDRRRACRDALGREVVDLVLPKRIGG